MNDDSPYDIQIHHSHPDPCVNEALLRDSIIAALRRFEVSAAELSIAVVGDCEIAALHHTYLDDPSTTDVLTFDLADAAVPGRLDGEIVISADTARRCADHKGHSLAAEIALYAVHGVLHLLGLDDATEADARRMHRIEDEILTAAGIGAVFGAS